MGTDYSVNLELIEKAQGGNTKALDKLIRLNLPLVSTISKRFLNRGYEYDDIFQIGCIGLMKTINDFNYSFGVRFSTYATPKILGEIKRVLRDGGSIKISRDLKLLSQKINYIKPELSVQLGKDPTTEEIATYLDITKEEVQKAETMYNRSNVISLDKVVDSGKSSGDKETTLGDTVSDDLQLEESMIRNIDLENALRSLPEDWGDVIKLRFIGDYTQVQIAGILGITQVQVSRLEKKALEKLKKELEGNNVSKKNEAIKMFKQGCSNKEVMEKLGITKGTMYTYKAVYNKERLEDKPTSSKKAEAFKFFAKGFNNPLVSERTGLGISTLTKYRNEFVRAKNSAFDKFKEGKTKDHVARELKIDMEIIEKFKEEWREETLCEEKFHSEIEVKTPPEEPEVEKTKEENILKPEIIKGKFLMYNLSNGSDESDVKLIRGKEILTIPGSKEDIKIIIKELEALLEVV